MELSSLKQCYNNNKYNRNAIRVNKLFFANSAGGKKRIQKNKNTFFFVSFPKNKTASA